MVSFRQVRDALTDALTRDTVTEKASDGLSKQFRDNWGLKAEARLGSETE